MAHVKDLAVVKDDLQNLLGGLAKELNRHIYSNTVSAYKDALCSSYTKNLTRFLEGHCFQSRSRSSECTSGIDRIAG